MVADRSSLAFLAEAVRQVPHELQAAFPEAGAVARDVLFGDFPPQFRRSADPDRARQHRHPKVRSRYARRHGVGPGRAEVIGEGRSQVVVENSTLAAFDVETGLGRVRFAAEDPRRLLGRLPKRELFEGVQRIVMDEDRDRTLGRQEVGGVVERRLQSSGRSADFGMSARDGVGRLVQYHVGSHSGSFVAAG